MAASDSVNDVAGWLDERLAAASPDLLRMMVKQFAETLMAAEADTVCGAEYRERSQARVNSRNGYRMRDWDTRAGSIELDPETAVRDVLPGMAAGVAPPRGAGAGLGGCHLVSAAIAGPRRSRASERPDWPC